MNPKWKLCFIIIVGLAKNAGKIPLPPPPPPAPKPDKNGGGGNGGGKKGGGGGGQGGGSAGGNGGKSSKYSAESGEYDQHSFYHPIFYAES